MNRKGSSKSGLFMMEMIMVVFFFILCASVSILVFVRADRMSQLAADTNRSVNAAQSIAEYLNSGSLEDFSREWEAESGADGSHVICWDKEWERSPQGDARYTATVTAAVQDGMNRYTISISKGEEPLYQLETAVYEKLE